MNKYRKVTPMDYNGVPVKRPKYYPKKAFLLRHSADPEHCVNVSTDTECHNQCMLDLLATGTMPKRQRDDSLSQISLPDELRLSFSESDYSSLQLDDIDLECSPSLTDLTSNNISLVDHNKHIEDKGVHKLKAALSSSYDSQSEYADPSAVSEQLQPHKESNCAPKIRKEICDEFAIKVEVCNEQEYLWSNMNLWSSETHSEQQISSVGSSGVAMQKKKASRRKSTKSKHTENVLCQVCGDIAAGFYCEAYVCEACKKFYMRAYKQDKLKYVCLRDKKCVITKESRVQCQYCRYQKCVMLNMYCSKQGDSDSSKYAHMSKIPCRVCTAPSSGFHFGAITCEGCKGFFRRMAKERELEKYQCNKSAACEINMITRNICKACRYKACIEAGMSVEGSRIGRQPNSIKHAISLELKNRGGSDTQIKEELIEIKEECSDENRTEDDLWNTSLSEPNVKTESNKDLKTENEFWNASLSEINIETECNNQNVSGNNHIATPVTSSMDVDFQSSHSLSMNSDSNMVFTTSWNSGISSLVPSLSTNMSFIDTEFTNVQSTEFLLSCSASVSSQQTQSRHCVTLPLNTTASVSLFPQKSTTITSNTLISPEVSPPKHQVMTRENTTMPDSRCPIIRNTTSSSNIFSATPPKYHTSAVNSEFSLSGARFQLKLHTLTPPPTPTQPVCAQFIDQHQSINGPAYTYCKTENTSSVPHVFTTTNEMSRASPQKSQPSQQTQVWDCNAMTNTNAGVFCHGGFMDNKDTKMEAFINKIVDAGKCLQLLNYRIYDAADVHDSTTMNVDDFKALFKNKCMDPKVPHDVKVDTAHLNTIEAVWEDGMKCFQSLSLITITFCKNVPGFKTLCLNDQVKLLQSSLYPIELLNLSKAFDPVTKEYNYFTHTKAEENILVQWFPMLKVFREHFIYIGEMVTSFQFTEEEFALLSALLLFPAEIGQLENPKAVEKLQNEISNALQYYEEKTFPDGLTRFGILLVRVAELVQCHLQHNLAIGLLLAHNPTIKVPQLFQELIIERIKE